MTARTASAPSPGWLRWRIERRYGILCLLAALLAHPGCRFERQSTEERGLPTDGPTGFRADVSGSIQGRIVAPGLVRYLPTTETVVGRRPGYYFIADTFGPRDLGITFTVPLAASLGSHALVSVSPLEAGNAFEVRVDHSAGNRVLSFDRNTSGTIELLDFPEAPEDLSEHRIAGRFEFTTHDPAGNTIVARGTFDFQADQAR